MISRFMQLFNLLVPNIWIFSADSHVSVLLHSCFFDRGILFPELICREFYLLSAVGSVTSMSILMPKIPAGRLSI